MSHFAEARSAVTAAKRVFEQLARAEKALQEAEAAENSLAEYEQAKLKAAQALEDLKVELRAAQGTLAKARETAKSLVDTARAEAAEHVRCAEEEAAKLRDRLVAQAQAPVDKLAGENKKLSSEVQSLEARKAELEAAVAALEAKREAFKASVNQL